MQLTSLCFKKLLPSIQWN